MGDDAALYDLSYGGGTTGGNLLGGLLSGVDWADLITGAANLGGALLPYTYGEDPIAYLKTQLGTLPSTLSGI